MDNPFQEATHETDAAMRHSNLELLKLADAFRLTGNARVAEELADIAMTLEKARHNLRQSYSRHLADNLEHARNDEARTLKLLLAKAED